MKTKTVTIFMVIVFGLIGLSGILFAQSMNDKMEIGVCNKTEVDLTLDMRKLWEDHITYTRNYVISALANLEDINAIAQRLLKNQDDIGNAIKPYYGDAAGKNLADLLREHIMVATEVVKAAKIGDKEELKKAQAKWNTNADDIAAFLSGANTNWAKKDLTDMLYKHLEYTTGEVTSRLKKDWVSDIDFYDKGHMHMLMFADMLTNGIVKQFPAKFSSQVPAKSSKTY